MRKMMNNAFLLCLWSAILFLFLFASASFAQSGKSQAVVAPIGSVGEISSGEKQILQNLLERKLSQRFDLISVEKFEEARQKAYETLDVNECTEDQCIRKIQEFLQVDHLFVLQIVREGAITQLKLTLVLPEDKKVAESLCTKSCAVDQLYGQVEELIKQVLVELDKTVSPEEAAPTAPKDIEEEMWSLVKNSNDIQDTLEFLQRYPKGRFAALAQIRLRQLETQQQEEQERLTQEAEQKRLEEQSAARNRHRLRFDVPVAVVSQEGRFRSRESHEEGASELSAFTLSAGGFDVGYVAPFKLGFGYFGVNGMFRNFRADLNVTQTQTTRTTTTQSSAQTVTTTATQSSRQTSLGVGWLF